MFHSFFYSLARSRLLLLLSLLLGSFSHHLTLMIFHRSLSDSKSPKVSKTLFSILADLNNAVIWMVSTHPLISKSSSHFINPLVTVPRAPITIGINVFFVFYNFFIFFISAFLMVSASNIPKYLYLGPSKVEIFIILLPFFQLYSVVSRYSKVHNLTSSLFFLLIIIKSGRLAETRRSVCMSKS